MSNKNHSGLRPFLKAAHENECEGLEEYRDFVDLLDRIDGFFRELLAVEFRGSPLAATLFMNAHASFLAASRLALSGQGPPTFMTLRGALESALYGLIASRSKENASVWLNRDKNLEQSRRLFTARNGLKLLKDDPNLSIGASEAYELTIEFGAHPNARSVLENLSLNEKGMSLTYLQGVASIGVARIILACIETGLVIIFICPHAFPDHEPALAVHAGACKIRDELDRFLQERGYLREPDDEENAKDNHRG